MFPAPTYPTPVVECGATSTPRVRLWLKNDGLTHPVYGGNKVRKLTHLVDEARRTGATRLLTFGATGSHQILATAVFARAHGLRAAAIVTPQPLTMRVVETLRASVAQGAELHPAKAPGALVSALARTWRHGDYLVPPGGSNPTGTLGYVDAAAELAEQIRRGELPEPDLVVLVVGTGGTTAGLLGGFARHGIRSRILGVRVVHVPLARAGILHLARHTLSRHPAPAGRVGAPLPSLRALGARLTLTERYLGAGYGHATPEGRLAMDEARGALGLELDPTYTAKAFAAALDVVRAASAGVRHVLYWHTLSAAPLEPLLEGAPPAEQLSPELWRVLTAS